MMIRFLYSLEVSNTCLINMGYKFLSSKKIIICALARNCASRLKKNLRRLTKLGHFFNEIQYIIVENDSDDNTRKILEDWKNSQSGVYLPDLYKYYRANEEFLNQYDINEDVIRIFDNNKMESSNKYFQRIKRISLARDCLLNALANIPFKADYVLMYDIDLAWFSMKGILDGLSSDMYWDVLSSNCRDYKVYSLMPIKIERVYYDSFAVEEFNSKTRPTDIKLEIQDKYATLKKSDPWIRVNSAFGGIAIYKYSSLIKENDNGESVPRITYLDAIIEDNFQICEHIPFHRNLRQLGYNKIYINPRMITYYNTFIQSIRKFLNNNQAI